jgi:uncharacterized membrane protein YphA (DoxX/SURF4 family)
MAKTSNRGLGALLLRIALAAYFIITGLCMLGVGGSIKSSEAGAAIYEIFSGDLAKILVIVVAILLLIGGVCIAITIFRDLGSWDNTVMLILTVLWIVIAVVADIFSRSFGVNKLDGDAMFWILNVAKDLLIIGGLLSIR